MTAELPNPSDSSHVPRFFASTNEIKAHFETIGVPTELKEAQDKSETYCFVLAFPYSGIDTTDLYCFVRRGEGWILFLKASLWKTPPGTVQFKADGNYMDILREGDVILKIKPPK